MVVLPRIVITAPASGHGKTTVATGLMAALRSEGLAVAGFKVGPDFIDPGYHTLATGRAGRNLDPVLCGEARLAPLLLHGAETPEPADIAVIEGVMGLFDGQLGGDGFASTAHVATVLRAPLVLVLDISSVSRTAAAIVHGLHTYDPAVRLAGVILNKSGSARHAAEVTAALETTGLPVLGVLPRDAGVEVPSRHLGLVTAAEQPGAAETVRRLGARVAEHLDLTALLALAHTAAPIDAEPWDPGASRPVSGGGEPSLDTSTPVVSGPAPVVAIAGGRAFTFRYAETDELLRAAGCEPVVFDPLRDRALPSGTAGLYLGGGFPEVHAAELSANTALRADIAGAIAAGLPTVAECAGLLYLCESVDGTPMVGAVPGQATMSGRLTLGYRSAVADRDQLLGPAGTRVHGHEFHRTVLTRLDPSASAWLLATPDGYADATLHASYLHVHWAGHPEVAQNFATAVHDFAARQVSWKPAWVAASQPEPDLDHHGDTEIGEGLVDLAVNVRVAAPPRWLADTIRATVDDLAAYPNPTAAARAIAAAHPLVATPSTLPSPESGRRRQRHAEPSCHPRPLSGEVGNWRNASTGPDGVRPEHVLPTAGAAEAFTLIARAFQPQHAVVVHPQFTEPEAALRTAGHRVHRVQLSADNGFRLDPAAIPERADLVVIGNPTNPTSVLHPRASLHALTRPGRLLVVDEAFMDAVPGEPETLLGGGPLDHVLVLRSLTKTWGVAGLRAGYVVGDPEAVARLRAQQPPWSTSTPALAVIEATLTPQARGRAAEAAVELGAWRDYLVDGLAELGLPVVRDPRAPFVLVDAHGWQQPFDGPREGHEPGWLRRALRERGLAVRRCDTFPGLDADWLRIAVREPCTTDSVLEALAAIRRSTRRTSP